MLALLALCLVPAALAVPKCSSDCDPARLGTKVRDADCSLPPWRVLPMPGMARGLGYYATSEIGKANSQYTLAVSYQHGMYEDPDVHFCAMQGALEKRYPEGNSSVLVISPHFRDYEGANNELFWDGQDWNMGDNSSSYGGATISSFSVYDRMVSVLMNKKLYPNLRKIVLVGHSAGGQTMVRYALGTQTPEPVDGLRLVVANPSTFPYLDERRPVKPAMTKFVKPSKAEVRSCPSYNSWRYGLNSMNEYMDRVGKETATNQWKKRDVVYLLGTADTCNEYVDPSCDSHGLDKGCEAMLQGSMRYERGCTWMRYLKMFYGAPTHRQVDVPGVDHHETKMIQADEASDVFFA